ncbi:MAG: transposase [Rickettsiales bacterium]|jgi:transposase
MSSTNKHLKKYSPDFKLKVVLKYLSEQITIAQICSEFNVSKSTLSKWVSQFKANSGNIFNDENSSKNNNKTNNKNNKKSSEKEITNLYAKIGELTVERDFLKKTLDS